MVQITEGSWVAFYQNLLLVLIYSTNFKQVQYAYIQRSWF